MHWFPLHGIFIRSLLNVFRKASLFIKPQGHRIISQEFKWTGSLQQKGPALHLRFPAFLLGTLQQSVYPLHCFTYLGEVLSSCGKEYSKQGASGEPADTQKHGTVTHGLLRQDTDSSSFTFTAVAGDALYATSILTVFVIQGACALFGKVDRSWMKVWFYKYRSF